MGKKYYILKIDSYDGDESSLMVNVNGSDSMYDVLVVDGTSAEVVYWGYTTVERLLDAWNNVALENIKEFVCVA